MNEEKNNLRITAINLSFGKLDADTCKILAEAIMDIGIGIDDEEVVSTDIPDRACDECYSEIAKKATESAYSIAEKLDALTTKNPDFGKTPIERAPCAYDEFRTLVAQYIVLCDILNVPKDRRKWAP